MSSIGVIDTTVSRLTLFEKGSLSTTKGGYRLMASRVNNVTDTPSGYVAFDLFIKNSSGAEYYQLDDPLNEEAIYLTNDSKVTVGSTGVANAGIENSVRVAFAQIGRVEASNTSASTIQGITCTSDSTVTGICRTAQIWEPNDTSHVASALTWYNTNCKARSGAATNLDASYSGDCGVVVDGQAYPTYAIGKEITATTAVDIYDGTGYNGYTGDIATTEAIATSTENENAGKYLYSYPYFTDTMKLRTGTARPAFITLAPNSITKVRVYIYIEGQDVDNYDFASIGKQISVNFGFTKERLTEGDFGYTGPDQNQGLGPINQTQTEDKTAPIINLNGDQIINLTVGDTFTAPTVESVVDNVDTLTSSDVTMTGTVNTNVPGTYRVVYEVRDTAGNLGTKVVTVNVASE